MAIVITPNLESVLLGPDAPESICKHPHPEFPATQLTQADIDELYVAIETAVALSLFEDLDMPLVGDVGKALVVNATYDGLEYGDAPKSNFVDLEDVQWSAASLGDANYLVGYDGHFKKFGADAEDGFLRLGWQGPEWHGWFIDDILTLPPGNQEGQILYWSTEGGGYWNVLTPGNAGDILKYDGSYTSFGPNVWAPADFEIDGKLYLKDLETDPGAAPSEFLYIYSREEILYVQSSTSGEKKIPNSNVVEKNLQRLMIDRKELQFYHIWAAAYVMTEYAVNDDDIDGSSVYSMPGEYFTPIEVGIGDPVETWSDSMTTDRSGLSLYHIRDIHSAANISTSGVQVRVTITAHSGATVEMTHVCFAERSGSTANAVGAFGSATFKEFLFGGVQNIYVAAGQPVTSDWLTFTVDEAKSYMTLMTYGTSNANGRHVTSGGDGYYEKTDSAADWDQPSVSGYTLNSAYSFGVVSIEVRPAIVAQNMSLICNEDTTDIVMTTARGGILVKNKHSSTKIHVSTATSPSWTEITGETIGATNVGDEGITEYVFGPQNITGSADKKLRWKVTTDAGHDTRVYGVVLGVLSTSSTTTSTTSTTTTTSSTTS